MMGRFRPTAMALQLVGSPRSRITIPRWYAEVKGIPYTWLQLDGQAGEHRQPPFLALNPFGKMPALVDDAFQGPDGTPLRLFESGAILLHLAEHHAGEFGGGEFGGGEFGGDTVASDPATAAGTGTAAVRRSLTAQWILYANSTFATALLQASSREDDLLRQLQVLDGLLAAGPLLGAAAGWGAADCAVQAYLSYLPLFCSQVNLDPFPGVRATLAATSADPAWRRVTGLDAG